jgi:hypothetical protein
MTKKNKYSNCLLVITQALPSRADQAATCLAEPCRAQTEKRIDLSGKKVGGK